MRYTIWKNGPGLNHSAFHRINTTTTITYTDYHQNTKNKNIELKLSLELQAALIRAAYSNFPKQNKTKTNPTNTPLVSQLMIAHPLYKKPNRYGEPGTEQVERRKKKRKNQSPRLQGRRQRTKANLGDCKRPT